MTVAYEGFRKLVLDRSGLVLTADKDYLLKSRLEPLARKDGFLGLDQLLAKVGAEPTGPLAQRCYSAPVSARDWTPASCPLSFPPCCPSMPLPSCRPHRSKSPSPPNVCTSATACTWAFWG